MSPTQAESATALSRLSDHKFKQALKNPKAPITIVRLAQASSPLYARFAHSAQNLRSICRSEKPAAMAKLILSLTHGEKDTARALCIEISEWLEELEQRLPK